MRYALKSNRALIHLGIAILLWCYTYSAQVIRLLHPLILK